jgi:hypothetical protein
MPSTVLVVTSISMPFWRTPTKPRHLPDDEGIETSPSQAGHPRLSFDANSKVVDGGAKPRHDDVATPRTP